MQQPFSASSHVNSHRQAYALLLLGVVFLIVARLGILNPYSLGVLLLGLGILGVAPFNPRRFLLAGWLMASLGVATFLMFRHSIPDSQVLTAHLLAIGLGLLGIAWMARRVYISAGALTPGFFVVGVGVTEYLQAVHLMPSTVVPFSLAPWIWPLCAWTGFSGCERKNIPGGAYENECSSWEYSSTSCERGQQVKRNMQEIQNTKEKTSTEQGNRSGTA